MSTDYTQFIIGEGSDDEEILATTHNAAVLIPPGTRVVINGTRYDAIGSVIYVDNDRIAVGVGVEEASS